MPEIPPRFPTPDDVERVVIQDFLDWLYEDGPDPNMVTRQKLYVLWRARHGMKAVAEGVVRYVPMDGHDWHSESPGDASKPRALAALEDKSSTRR
jgi:hypothetical protein